MTGRSPSGLFFFYQTGAMEDGVGISEGPRPAAAAGTGWLRADFAPPYILTGAAMWIDRHSRLPLIYLPVMNAGMEKDLSIPLLDALFIASRFGLGLIAHGAARRTYKITEVLS
jgi:hypothetical protein